MNDEEDSRRAAIGGIVLKNERMTGVRRALSVVLAAALLLTAVVFSGCSDGAGQQGEARVRLIALDPVLERKADEYASTDAALKASFGLGENRVVNGDFSAEDNYWSIYTESGGNGAIALQDGALVVSVDSIGEVGHGLQIYYDRMSLSRFSEYEFSFTASTTAPQKMVEARIQLNGGAYTPYCRDVVTVTGEPKRFSIPFVMDYEDDPSPRLCFNCGKIDENEIADAFDPFTITFDDVAVICTSEARESTGEEEKKEINVNLNQLGYRCDAEKTAIFRGMKTCREFEVVNEDGEVVYTGVVSPGVANDNAREINFYGDFSAVTEPGVYTVRAGAFGESYPFTIGDDVYEEAFRSIVRMFFMQRCGCELTYEFGGQHAHAACHTGKAKIYGTDEYIDVTGGWHDAGDYGRYVVASAKTAADLLAAYEAAPDIFTDYYDIPESGNGVPDILDEVRWELEWMLKMQDPATGGVHHKVSNAEFPGEVMPHMEADELVVCEVSECATADFAAVMARAAGIYERFDEKFAGRCLAAAVRAFDYFENCDCPDCFYNPADVTTGEYSDPEERDELCWAAAELYRATGDAKYGEAVDRIVTECSGMTTGLGWADVGGYAINTYLSLDEKLQNAATAVTMRAALENTLREVVDAAKNDGYHTALEGGWPWGSNMTVLNNAILLMNAEKLGADIGGASGRELAQMQLDYIFGANPMAMSYVTGFGSVSPQNPHHRPSQVKKTPVEGMLVGGPDSFIEDPCAIAMLTGCAPAKCYIDNTESYSTNEVSIYWNSPLVCVMAMLAD